LIECGGCIRIDVFTFEIVYPGGKPQKHQYRNLPSTSMFRNKVRNSFFLMPLPIYSLPKISFPGQLWKVPDGIAEI